VIDVGAVADLQPGEPRLVDVEGTPVCLVNVEGTVRAVHDVCTHAYESLSGGWVDGDTIECPRHGALFSLETGDVLSPPATRPLPTSGWRSRTDASCSTPRPAMTTRSSDSQPEE
jgi:3-phenylpropionate/trans-cinnamate dioxygenase ferredoxin subunit